MFTLLASALIVYCDQDLLLSVALAGDGQHLTMGVGRRGRLASRHLGLVAELSPSGLAPGAHLGKPPLMDLCDLAGTL